MGSTSACSRDGRTSGRRASSPTLQAIGAASSSRKLGDRGLELADVFLQTAPDFRLARSQSSRCGRSAARPATGSRKPSSSPPSAVAGTSRRCRASTFDGDAEPSRPWALPRRAGLALRDGPGTGRHVLRRGARRLDRPDARAGRPARAVGPRPDADARLHPLHPERRPRRRGGAADRVTPATSTPAAPGRAGSRHRSRKTSSTTDASST